MPGPVLISHEKPKLCPCSENFLPFNLNLGWSWEILDGWEACAAAMYTINDSAWYLST